VFLRRLYLTTINLTDWDGTVLLNFGTVIDNAYGEDWILPMRRGTITNALAITGIFISLMCGSLQAGERATLSLDGTWDIEDSVSPDRMPTAFRHHVPVPGLAHLSVPAFPDVDQFESYENHHTE